MIFFTQWLLHLQILSDHFLKYKVTIIWKILKLLSAGLMVAKHNLRMVAICDIHHVLFLRGSLKYFDIKSLVLLISHIIGNSLCMNWQ